MNEDAGARTGAGPVDASPGTAAFHPGTVPDPMSALNLLTPAQRATLEQLSLNLAKAAMTTQSAIAAAPFSSVAGEP